MGLERAGFSHEAAVEVNPIYCETLEANRPDWNVVCSDLADFDPAPYSDVDLLSGGLPCPPFSVAGKQEDAGDDRNCFPEALRITKAIRPKAIMFENVPGLLQRRFVTYRSFITHTLKDMGYASRWFKVISAEHGVPQYRPRTILVGIRGLVDIPDIPSRMAGGGRPRDGLRHSAGSHGCKRVEGTR